MFPGTSITIYKAVIDGKIKLAVKLQSLLIMIREILKSFGLESSALVKEVMKLCGIDVGYLALLNGTLDENELTKLRSKLTPIINKVEDLLKKTYLFMVYMFGIGLHIYRGSYDSIKSLNIRTS